jgi:PIN domain nuclease of toxin-antitoxin system
LLLDTHTLVWWTFSPRRLSRRALEAISEAETACVSAISAMEIATKVRLGKFEEARPLATNFTAQVTGDGFTILEITAEHGERAGGLSVAHKDPWDRLLMAQAQVEDLLLVTDDGELAQLSAATFW